MSSRLFTESTLVIATHNTGKVREISELLKPYANHIKLITAGELGLPAPAETGTTFAENASIKALAVATAARLPALADDSGLSVVALDGLPGVYSADWAGPTRDFGAAMARIHTELGPAADRSAYFSCCFALAWPDGHIELAQAREDGTLIWPPRGIKGFGYDPIFVPAGETRTFAEMSLEEKQARSHRAQAFHLLGQKCFKNRN